MSTMLDRLRRFRPVGTPGGAGPVAVPVDARDGTPAELAPVFEALDAVIAECEHLRTRAAEQAADLVAAARAEAAATVAGARTRAAAERAEAAAAARARADAAADRTLATAEADAERLRQRGAGGMDALVALVLDRIRADAGSSGAL